MTPRHLILMIAMFTLLTGSVFARSVGTVIGINGEVTAERGGQTLTLALKSAVHAQDRITTRAGARVQILFEDDSLIALGEQSDLTIDALVYDPDNADDCNFAIRLGRGIYRLITGKITDLNPDRFHVETARSSIGIRGCELGFFIEEDADRILLIRIPFGREILIGPRGQPEPDRRSFQRAGRMVTVFDNGRLRVGAIPPGDVQQLNEASRGDEQADDAQNDNDDQQPNGENLPPETDLGTPQSDTPNPPAAPQSNMGLRDRETSDAVLQDNTFEPDSEDNENDDNRPAALRQSAPNQPGSTPSTNPQNPDPQDPDPQDPTLETRPVNQGGGVGADYTGDGNFLYRINSQKWTINQAQFSQSLVDGAVQDTTEATFDITLYSASTSEAGDPFTAGPFTLTRDPAGTAYNGVTDQVEGNVTVTADNLAEFVRYTDTTLTAPRLAYWGIPTASDADPLPADSLVTYEVDHLRANREINGPDASAIESMPLLLNTRTGAWALESSDRFYYGTLDDMTLFGQSAQGIGGITEAAFPTDIGNSGSIIETDLQEIPPAAVAGFLDPDSPTALASGSRTLQGYAVAIDQPPLGGTTTRFLQSANPISELPADNEQRVTFTLDRDATLNPVDLTLHVAVDPAMTIADPNDIQLGTPTDSLYVQDDRFQATYDNSTDEPAVVAARGGGENWVWGEWAGTHTVDFDTGPLPQYMQGFWSIGDVVSASDFANIAGGAQSYSLSTPTDRPGQAAAVVGNASGFATLLGTAALTIDIPGNSQTATWTGNFNLDNANGDKLTAGVGTSGFITSDGRLSASADSYSLTYNGTTRNGESLGPNSLTGNLVGPGSGDTPITGAIGQGAFTHTDGTEVRMVFGTDLTAGRTR